ncbi:MAG: hypothetical protein HGA76_08580 [Candidatus Firestonebacteria bacterium]|nr:hypothetical protein [Candidatus Firestonebacteria bacterium]
MRKQWWGVAGVSLALVMVVLGACTKKDEVLATVGKNTVTLSEFNLALSNLPETYKVLTMTFKGKRQILDNLVKKSLLVQEAEERGLAKDAAIKKRVAEQQVKSREKLQSLIAELQHQLTVSDRQVYETILVTELNGRLKQESASDKEIGETDIEAYYEDYTHKLQTLNPAAKVPDIAVVTNQIRAILAEEKLIKALEKKSKVAVEEEKFQKLFGDTAEPVVQDNTAH